MTRKRRKKKRTMNLEESRRTERIETTDSQHGSIAVHGDNRKVIIALILKHGQ